MYHICVMSQSKIRRRPTFSKFKFSIIMYISPFVSLYSTLVFLICFLATGHIYFTMNVIFFCMGCIFFKFPPWEEGSFFSAKRDFNQVVIYQEEKNGMKIYNLIQDKRIFSRYFISG